MSSPLVIIVGRPNVGKSTLFNRLTGNRNAIVDDVSGVTRDRIYGEVEWSGRKFRLIDTGGYVSDSADIFEASIREQVELGLNEADLILFVVDGTKGLTPLDEEIARMLRASDKPSYLLVNKIDTAQSEIYKADFYRLGFPKIYDIAAISGRNTGDLLDDVLDDLNFSSVSAEGDERLRISIVGRPNVGKSSLTNALLGYDRSIVTDIPGTTRDSIDSVMKYYGEEIVLVDTAGLRKKAKVKENIEFYSNVRTLKAIGDCDVSVILIDATVGIEKQDLYIIQEAVQRRKGIIIAINKWDLVEKETNTAVMLEKSILKKLGSVDYVPIIFISAKTKQRISKLIEMAKEIERNRKFKPGTTQLNDTLLPEFAQKPPPATPTGKEVKIKYITQVGEHYPVFLIFANFSKYIPDHYKRFMEKTIRKHFNYNGVPFTIVLKDS